MQENENQQAKHWRTERGFTVDQLSDLTGYSREAIYCFERGKMANGNIVPEWVWQRFKMACAGVDAQTRFGRNFMWEV